MTDLDGRVFAIAGAGGGLGPVVAKHLADAGASLSLADRSQEIADGVADDLGIPADRVDPQAVDLLDESAANAWAGHDKEAKETAAQLQKVQPGYTVQTWAGRHMSDDPTYNAEYQRVTEGLRKAGVPEGEKKTD